MKNVLDKRLNPKKGYNFKNKFYLKHWIYYPLAYLLYWLDIGYNLFEKNILIGKFNPKRTERIIKRFLEKSFRIKVNQEEKTITINIIDIPNWTLFAKWYDKQYCLFYKHEIKDYFIEKFEVPNYNKTIKENKRAIIFSKQK